MLQKDFTPKSAAASTASCIGQRCEFLRWDMWSYRRLTGTIRAAQTHQVMRWNGGTVTEYTIEVDPGQINRSTVTVYEGDITRQWVTDHQCPRCNGVGHIGIVNGSDDISCPECGFVDTDEVF